GGRCFLARRLLQRLCMPPEDLGAPIAKVGDNPPVVREWGGCRADRLHVAVGHCRDQVALLVFHEPALVAVDSVVGTCSPSASRATRIAVMMSAITNASTVVTDLRFLIARLMSMLRKLPVPPHARWSIRPHQENGKVSNR